MEAATFSPWIIAIVLCFGLCCSRGSSSSPDDPTSKPRRVLSSTANDDQGAANCRTLGGKLRGQAPAPDRDSFAQVQNANERIKAGTAFAQMRSCSCLL